MDATLTKDSKIINISSKRQITIPQKYFTLLGFETEAECLIENDALIIRPVHQKSAGELDDIILEDLIKRGYTGSELLSEFKKAQLGVRTATYNMLKEAKSAAENKTESMTLDDVFGED